jgi:hypothetical protein
MKHHKIYEHLKNTREPTQNTTGAIKKVLLPFFPAPVILIFYELTSKVLTSKIYKKNFLFQ